MVNTKDGPKITVITVTYNSADTLLKTMTSVLEQTYLPYEYIIIDGGAADGTLAVIDSAREGFDKKGIRLLVTSEPDNGIYDAMNKGIGKATGDIIGIINSDDWYEPDALETVAAYYSKEPFDLFYADLRMVFPTGRTFVKHSKDSRYQTSRNWNHPTTFITRQVYDKNKYRTDSLHDDYDLILRLKKEGVRTTVVNKVLANFTMSGVSHKRGLSGALTSIREKYAIYRQNGYSRLYLIEPVMEEFGKLIIG